LSDGWRRGLQGVAHFADGSTGCNRTEHVKRRPTGLFHLIEQGAGLRVQHFWLLMHSDVAEADNTSSARWSVLNTSKARVILKSDSESDDLVLSVNWSGQEEFEFWM
jgi:hypothetical protein